MTKDVLTGHQDGFEWWEKWSQGKRLKELGDQLRDLWEDPLEWGLNGKPFVWWVQFNVQKSLYKRWKTCFGTDLALVVQLWHDVQLEYHLWTIEITLLLLFLGRLRKISRILDALFKSKKNVVTQIQIGIYNITRFMGADDDETSVQWTVSRRAPSRS